MIAPVAFAVATLLAFGPGAAAADAPTLLESAEAETRAAVAEAAAAGHPVECQPTVALAHSADDRSWAWFDECRIDHDPDIIDPGAWWQYIARHEVCHMAHRWASHSDPGFRACESALAHNVGLQLVYGDDPDGYPVEYVPVPADAPPDPPGTVRIDQMTTDAASLTPDPDDDLRLCLQLQEAKPWIDWTCEENAHD